MFDLLGFRHYWARSRWGSWVIKRKTAPSRFTRALKRFAGWCRLNRHRPVKEQHRIIVAKLRGHCQYYGITGNSIAISRFRFEMAQVWRRWLSRRSQRARMPWDRFCRFLERYALPPAKCVHSSHVTQRTMARGAGCGKSARPDL